MALNTKTSEEKDHAEFSASGSARWLNCPGSHELSKQAPPAPENRYAAEGTAAHACLEFLLKNRLNLDAAVAKAQKNPEWDSDMVYHALAAVAWVLERLESEGKGATLLCETRVDASYFTCTGQFGTLDAAVAKEFGRLTVIDYKYGAGIAVDPVDDDGELNSQLVYYALGVSKLYEHNFAEVELVVIQPRAYHETGDTVRSVTVPMDDLLAWVERFRAGVMATSDKQAPVVPGKWCKYCTAATICPELKVKAMKDAQIAFSDQGGIESIPEPSMISIPHLGTILGACDKLEAWIKKVREHAEYALTKGREIPGYKLVQKRGQRKWINAAEAEREAVSRFGSLALSEPKLLSPAQLEKSAKGVAGVDQWVSARTTAESSGTTIARDSDKRPAVVPAKTVFAAIPLLASKKKKK